MSTKDIAKATTKPTKPYPEFPLFPHATRRWAKKIRGKFVFFGPWDDPNGALQRYLDQKDEIHAGRVPRAQQQEGLTLRELVNRYLNAKKRKMEVGELKPMSFNTLYRISRQLIEEIGRDRLVSDIVPDDFSRLRAKIAHGGNPVLRWMLSCTEVVGDKNQNLRPVKPERKTGKRIDGVVATIMALGRATITQEFRSVYETRGILYLEDYDW